MQTLDLKFGPNLLFWRPRYDVTIVRPQTTGNNVNTYQFRASQLDDLKPHPCLKHCKLSMLNVTKR